MVGMVWIITSSLQCLNVQQQEEASKAVNLQKQTQRRSIVLFKESLERILYSVFLGFPLFWVGGDQSTNQVR